MNGVCSTVVLPLEDFVVAIVRVGDASYQRISLEREEGAPGRCQDVGEGKRDLIARFQFLTFLLGEAEVAVARLAVMPLLVVSFSSLFFSL